MIIESLSFNSGGILTYAISIITSLKYSCLLIRLSCSVTFALSFQKMILILDLPTHLFVFQGQKNIEPVHTRTMGQRRRASFAWTMEVHSSAVPLCCFYDCGAEHFFSQVLSLDST